MAISLVTDLNGVPQVASIFVGGNGGSVSFPAGTQVGNLIIAFVYTGMNNDTITISDNLGNTYYSAVGPASNITLVATVQIFYAYSLGGNTTVTFNHSIAGNAALHIVEYYGVADSPVDQTNISQANSGIPTGGNVTTTSNGELILGFAVNAGVGAGTGFTAIVNTAGAIQSEFAIQATAGTINTVFTGTSSPWIVLTATLTPGTGTRSLQTIDNIASWVIVDMLHRTTSDTDVQSVARNAALSFYKILCAKVPFDELFTTSPFFNLSVGRSQYQIGTDFPFNPTLRAIGDIQINLGTISSPNFRRLRRSHIRVFDALSILPSSFPSTYARHGLSLYFNPPPVQVYPVQFRYWSRPQIVPGANFFTTAIVTPEEWDELIKWETLFRVYYALDRAQDALSLVQPPMTQMMPGSPRKQSMYQTGIIPRLWNDLLSTTSSKENVDEDFSINPVIRPYSMREG